MNKQVHLEKYEDIDDASGPNSQTAASASAWIVTVAVLLTMIMMTMIIQMNDFINDAEAQRAVGP